MKTEKKILIYGILMFFFSSCVSTKEFNETKSRLNAENEQLKGSNMELEAANAELTSRVERLSSRNEALQKQLNEALYDLNVQKQNNSALKS